MKFVLILAVAVALCFAAEEEKKEEKKEPVGVTVMRV
jgi:hypothetical protein